MIGLIWAQDPNGVIGVNGGMPWHYREDFKRFKARTMGSTLIMGRKTWESLPKPLPGRRAFVVTRNFEYTSKHPAESFRTFWFPKDAIGLAEQPAEGFQDVWVAGGAEVYGVFLTDFIEKVDVLDLTMVPEAEIPEGASVTHMPAIPFERFRLVEETRNEADPRLLHRVYHRVDAADPA